MTKGNELRPNYQPMHEVGMNVVTKGKALRAKKKLCTFKKCIAVD